MMCPRCSRSLRVLEARQAGFRTRRRLVCEECRQRFTSYESLGNDDLQVVKRDGTPVDFKLGRLRRGIEKGARGTAMSRTDVSNAAARVMEAAVEASARRSVTTEAVGRMVLAELGNLGARAVVARIRFAMVFLSAPGAPLDLEGFTKWMAKEYQDDTKRTSVPIVRKRDGRGEKFDRRKIARGIGIASKGRADDESVRDLADEVADIVTQRLSAQPILMSWQIAAAVLEELRTRDAIAYLRYASAVKRFADEQDFFTEARALKRRR